MQCEISTLKRQRWRGIRYERKMPHVTYNDQLLDLLVSKADKKAAKKTVT